MIILADASPSNSELGLWLQCATLVITLVVGVIVIIKSIRNDAEKREVTISGDAASKEEFDRHAKENREDINSLHTKIGKSERETRDQSTKAVGEVTAQIVLLSHTVGKITAINEIQTQQLQAIGNKIDHIIQNRKS